MCLQSAYMPRKPPERRKEVRKDKNIHIRVTEDQKKILEAGAERAGLGLSSWLLMLGLKAAGEGR